MAKRNRKGQFVKGGARRARRKRARRPSTARKTLGQYRAAVAGLFRRKLTPKRRRTPNPPRFYMAARRDAHGRWIKKARGLSDAMARRWRLWNLKGGEARRGGGTGRKMLQLEEAHARRATVAKYRGLTRSPFPGGPKRTNPPKKRKRTMSRALARNSKGHFVKRGRRSVTVKVANPRRRRRRASPHAKHHGRRMRRHYARRARNPMGGGLITTAKASLMPMALGGLAGATAGYVDAKWLPKSATTSILFKVIAAIAGAALLGKRHPLAAAGWSGGLIGATGYYAGVKLGGGLVALNKAGALKGLADMAADDPDLAAQIAGLGDVVDDMGDDAALGDAAGDYNEALSDAEDMADVVDE